MIFKNVNELSDKTEKSFFVEQLQVYIRIVEVYCEKNGIKLEHVVNEIPIEELKCIGMISEEKDLDTLHAVSGAIYDDFISAVSFASKHRREMQGYLDKLYNSERNRLQM